MSVRPDIVCSESGMDLKDKKAMQESEQRNCHTPIFGTDPNPVDQDTLSDIIREAQFLLINGRVTQDSVSANITTISEEQKRIYNVPALLSTELLRQEWVIPSRSVDKSIMSGNFDDYVFINCTFTRGAVGRLVLCNIYKDNFSDGSFKTRFSPITASTVKRMPE